MRILITGSSGFIGSHAMDHFAALGWEALGTDIVEPREPRHGTRFKKCDLTDAQGLRSIVEGFQPEFVLHLGARTDVFERKSLSGYAANIEGVRNLIAALGRNPRAKRVVFTSSRLVCRVGHIPKRDDEFCPPNFYGKSKVEGEFIVKSANLDFEWLITRPTAIWGPGFLVPSYRDFFEQIRRGRYFHAQGANPTKTFGYVKNFPYQMEKLFLAPTPNVQGRIFYVGDYKPVKMREWAEMIAREFGLSGIRSVPVPALRLAATAGDLLKKLGWNNVPLTNYRLQNILCDAVHDCSALQEISGPLPYELERATAETVEWLKRNP